MVNQRQRTISFEEVMKNSSGTNPDQRFGRLNTPEISQPSTGNQSPVHQLRPNQSNSGSNSGVNSSRPKNRRESPTSSTSLSPSQPLQQTSGAQPFSLKPLTSQQEPSASKPSKSSCCRKTKIMTGRTIMILLLAASCYSILTISMNGGKNSKDGWPWGFWYVAAFVFDQCFFLPFTSLLQYLLVYCAIVKKSNPRGCVHKFAKWIIGKDIMRVILSRVEGIQKNQVNSASTDKQE